MKRKIFLILSVFVAAVLFTTPLLGAMSSSLRTYFLIDTVDGQVYKYNYSSSSYAPDSGSSETDPVFTGSFAFGIASGDITNWNNKLSSYTETDPVVKALTGIITSNGTAISAITDSSTNWDSGYTYRLTSASGTTPLTLTLASNGLTGSITQANTSTSGYLSNTDWNTFNGKGTGTVTSAGLALPTEFTVTNSPVTGTGTLTGAWKSETAKYFFAAPNAADGTPSFRAIAASDIPTLNQSTSGSSASCTGNAATVTGLSVTAGKTLTLSDTTTLATNSITLAGGEVITFSATNALQLLTTAGTSVTLPTTGTLFSTTTEVPNENIPVGINKGTTTADFSQAMAAGTYYYIPDSKLTMPVTAIAGMKTTTRLTWRLYMKKTAAGTAAFNICIYRGVNGTIADTRDVTQSIGVATAALDNMVVDVQLTVTTTGATGAYHWSICANNKAATATGFGIAVGAGQFSGNVSSVAMNTAALIFGIGVMGTTGTTTLTIPYVAAQAFNMD